MKKLLLSFLIILLLILIWILVNTLMFSNKAVSKVEAIEKPILRNGCVDRFQQALKIPTISYAEDADIDTVNFEAFNALLKNNYPLIYQTCSHKIFNNYSHLFEWEGSDSSLKPIVLMAHLDVVPIASLPLWTVHPFQTGLRNDTIFGRGTMDDKCSLVAILEAVEWMLEENNQPERTVYMAFGHDEEISGKRGAAEISKYLDAKGVKPLYVLDEGMAKIDGLVPGLEEEVAMIGVAEKGYLTVEMTVNMSGGHSSTPAHETSIDVLAEAVSKVKKNPLKRSLTPILKNFLDAVGYKMGFTTRMAIANPLFFKPLILNSYEASDAGNAMIRTTVSPTIFEAGIKDNVIPTSARAVVNFRLLPGDNSEKVIEHLKEVINDERVHIDASGNWSKASPISPMDGKAYLTIDKTIRQIFPNILVAPGLVVGATDARYFTNICDNVYRFVPYTIDPDNINCFHGIDERVLKSEFEDAILFYRQLILNSN